MLVNMYPKFADVHVMIFLGFGFLMIFLKCHCLSAIALSFLAASWSLQCCILMTGFWRCAIVEGFHHKINVNLLMVLEGEFCAGAVLITMGALLGKCTLHQLIFIATIESVFFTLNAVCLFELFHILDIGGAMTIHTFGAFFGICCTFFFQPDKAREDKLGQKKTGYHTNYIAFVGSIFLFMFWPSFNAVLASGEAQHRAIVNTVISMCASTMSSTFISRLFFRKYDMEVM